jgi:protein-tyrosine-phosphatase
VLERRPQAVLFACSYNALRSPMAAALATHLAGREIYFASAGVRAGELDDFAVAVMDELGIDLSRHRPVSFDDLEDMSFDLIVTLSPEAHHKALELTRTLALEVVYWPTPDPSVVAGSRDQILTAYRGVRDALMRRVKALLDWRPMGSV